MEIRDQQLARFEAGAGQFAGRPSFSVARLPVVQPFRSELGQRKRFWQNRMNSAGAYPSSTAIAPALEIAAQRTAASWASVDSLLTDAGSASAICIRRNPGGRPSWQSAVRSHGKTKTSRHQCKCLTGGEWS